MKVINILTLLAVSLATTTAWTQPSSSASKTPEDGFLGCYTIHNFRTDDEEIARDNKPHVACVVDTLAEGRNNRSGQYEFQLWRRTSATDSWHQQRVVHASLTDEVGRCPTCFQFQSLVHKVTFDGNGQGLATLNVYDQRTNTLLWGVRMRFISDEE